jgi:hypothetical protein
MANDKLLTLKINGQVVALPEDCQLDLNTYYEHNHLLANWRSAHQLVVPEHRARIIIQSGNLRNSIEFKAGNYCVSRQGDEAIVDLSRIDPLSLSVERRQEVPLVPLLLPAIDQQFERVLQEIQDGILTSLSVPAEAIAGPSDLRSCYHTFHVHDMMQQFMQEHYARNAMPPVREEESISAATFILCLRDLFMRAMHVEPFVAPATEPEIRVLEISLSERDLNDGYEPIISRAVHLWKLILHNLSLWRGYHLARGCCLTAPRFQTDWNTPEGHLSRTVHFWIDPGYPYVAEWVPMPEPCTRKPPSPSQPGEPLTIAGLRDLLGPSDAKRAMFTPEGGFGFSQN